MSERENTFALWVKPIGEGWHVEQIASRTILEIVSRGARADAEIERCVILPCGVPPWKVA